MIKATAILITKDKDYPKEVLDSLPQFDEVVIHTSCPHVWRRYELAREAKNDLVYVQDDDCVIDVKSLHSAYNGLLTNAITEHHLDRYGGSGITLVGFGCFFPKRMLDFSKYLDRFGMSDLLLTQADRVFTYLNQPHNSVVMDVNHLPSATDSTRMSTQEDHWDNLRAITGQLNLLD